MYLSIYTTIYIYIYVVSFRSCVSPNDNPLMAASQNVIASVTQAKLDRN